MSALPKTDLSTAESAGVNGMKNIDSFRLRKEGEDWRIVDSDGIPVEEVVRFLRTVMLRGLSPGTYRTYALDLLCAYRWMDEEQFQLNQIGGEQLLQFVEFLRKRPSCAQSTTNRRLRLLQRLVEFVTGSPPTIPAWEQYSSPVFHARSRRGVVRMKEPRRVIKPLKDVEVIRLYDSMKTWRDRAMVLFMWAAGLRTMEVLNLRMEDVDFQRMDVLIRGKGSIERMMPICELIVKVLLEYLKSERPQHNTSALFLVLKGPCRGQPMRSETVRRIFRYHRKISGVPQANPHRLRHTFGAQMTRNGTPLLMLAQMMGHASPRTTMGYVQIDDREIRKYYLAALKNINPEDFLNEPEA
jgi:site-specific recombinase XerD